MRKADGDKDISKFMLSERETEREREKERQADIHTDRQTFREGGEQTYQ